MNAHTTFKVVLNGRVITTWPTRTLAQRQISQLERHGVLAYLRVSTRIL